MRGAAVARVQNLPRWVATALLGGAVLVSMVHAAGVQAAETVVVGSKRFTESYILGEIVAQTAKQSGASAEHRQGLGNTAVVLEALKTGAIDVYPEYIGTIESEILKLPPHSSAETLAARLAEMHLAYGVPLGFSNSYALALTAERARALGIDTLSQLKPHAEVRVGVSQEFLGRADGWPGLAKRYGLPQQPIAIDHGLAYQALKSGRIDVTDIYTTDAQIAELGLKTLADDAQYFPRYDAVLLYRADLPTRAPQAWNRIGQLANAIDVDRMIRMNADAEVRGKSFAAIAASFLEAPRTSAGTAHSTAAPASTEARASLLSATFGNGFWRLTREHLSLVGISVAIALLLGIPLGTWANLYKPAGHVVFGVVGLLQTIPSLALLAALIPLLGRIGTVPAIVALALYALLPIVRNTAVGLQQVPAGTLQAATALGMTGAQRWRLIQLPLALPVIVAGVKTATVMTVGTATIAAFIGAGGYGERIAQGLALNDGTTLLAGAIPSAGLAIVLQLVFEGVDRLLNRPHQ